MNNHPIHDTPSNEYPPSLIAWDKLAKDDPELAFYQLQDAMHKIFEWMALEEKMHGFPIMPMKQIAWRDDEEDYSRAIANLVVQLVDTFNETPSVAKKICSESMRWPFLHDRFANNNGRVEQKKADLNFTSSPTNRPSLGIGLQHLCAYSEIRGKRPSMELITRWPTRESLQKKPRGEPANSQPLSLANSVLLHHLREIEEYRATPPYLRNKYEHSSAHYVQAHNLSHSHGVKYSANFEGKLPRFWESWQSEALKLPPLSRTSANDWMRVIWDLKILPEYLQKPARKPHNPSIGRQADLTILGVTQALARYRKQAKTSEELRRHEARIAAGEEDEGAMAGDIKQALRMALHRHAEFRDKHMREAVPFSW